jgi:hypothetical protein
LLLLQPALAQVTFDVTVREVPGAQISGLPPFSDYADRVIRHVRAAGAEWAQYLRSNAVVSVTVAMYPESSLPPDNPQLLADTPMTFRERSGVVRSENGFDVVEFAPAYRIRTGHAIDDSGLPDVTIRIGERYLKETLFFDADPMDRTGPVPAGKTEAYGRFVHELGHALGFNGFYRGDGTYDPTTRRSTFDQYITRSADGTSWFNGPLATQFYGGPVPLTVNERGHLGSDGDDRLFSLSAAEAMNGRTVFTGTRYGVSELDVRILCDIGVPCVLQADAGPAAQPAAMAATAIEYYNAALDHYFITTIADEIAKLDAGSIAGWTRTGETFNVFPANASARLPVCRFFSASFAPKSSHFYTPFDRECALVRGNPDWQYEATVFSVDAPDASGQCPYPELPLYRLYNDGQGGAPNHRYTTAPAVRAAMLAKGWIPEGVGELGVIACVPQ